VGEMVIEGSALVATIVAAAPKAHASPEPPNGGEHLPPVGHTPSGGHK